MVVSMLSERVVLRVLLMLAEWASAKSSTSLDDKIVTKIRLKAGSVWETLMLLAYLSQNIPSSHGSSRG